MASETFEVSLRGSAPWGFRLQGGKEFRAPLLIAKVTSGSKAAKEGIIVGDWLISINNEPCDDMTHSSALNSIKRTGKDLVLTLERRPFDGIGSYAKSTNSLPRKMKLTNGVSANNNDFKSVEGYATLPRSGGSQNRNDTSHLDYDNDFDAPDKGEDQRPSLLNTQSSGASSRYSEDTEELSSRGYGSLSPTNDEWSPDIISDAVRTPQPIRLISHDEPPSLITASNTESTRVKSPTSVHGFTDKPSPVGRGARRTSDEESKDSKDNPLLNSGSAHGDEDLNGDDSAAEQPYRRYSYHGSVRKDAEPRSPDAGERPRIQAGSGWYKELFKEMHTGAGNSTGLSSLLAGDASPPKNDARGLFRGYRPQSTEDSVIRATKTQDTQADPSNPHTRYARYSRPVSSADADRTNRYSTSSIPSSTATSARSEVQMREKPTSRSNVPSWYKELQKGKEVSEEEIIEDHARQQKGYQVPGGVRTPGDVGPEYPVVRSFSIGSRPSSGPVVHREPPQRMNTNTYRQSNAPDRQSKPAMRYTAAASRNKAASPPKETNKPSASNLYEDHLRNRRQQSPGLERKQEEPESVDYIKQFEEEEERHKEDERRAKEDFERRLREENKAKEEAEMKRRKIEMRKKEEEEARKNPKRARALYNFSPQSVKEIGFRKGDIIAYYRTIDSNWCEGEAQGKTGFFPSSYIEILEEDVFKAEGEGKVKYNFKAESPRELNLQKGDIVVINRQIDKNWYEGVMDEKIGIFPVSYIEVLREPAERRQGSPKKVQEEIIKQNGLPEVQSSPEVSSQQRSHGEQQMFKDARHADVKDGDINNLDGERYVVVFGYAPQNEDELELADGDFVKVVEKCDDGWFVGISERTGDFGTFPGNYVKEIS